VKGHGIQIKTKHEFMVTLAFINKLGYEIYNLLIPTNLIIHLLADCSDQKDLNTKFRFTMTILE
jgi:hypothetical protein